MAGTSTMTSSPGGRGTGRSYWPNERVARWPTIDPAAMPRVMGWSIPISWPSQAVAASSSSGSRSVGSATAGVRPDRRPPGSVPDEPRLWASDSNSGRWSSSVRLTHWVRVTGVMVMPAPWCDGVEPAGVGDLELGHPGQLLELDARQRVDVGLGLAVGGDAVGDLAGRVPGDAGPGGRSSGPGRRRRACPRRGRSPLMDAGRPGAAMWRGRAHDGIVCGWHPIPSAAPPRPRPWAASPSRGPSALGRAVVDALRGAGDRRRAGPRRPGRGRPGSPRHRRRPAHRRSQAASSTAPSVLVHLASVFGASLDEDPAVEAAEDVVAAQRLLDAAGDVGVEHVVLLSSAAVYGAWANNAMPLTEDATLRPCPDLAYAVQRAEIERRLAEWRHDHPSATATVLRPAPVVGDDGPDGWLARALHAARRVADVDGDPPSQFVHVDDLAAAVVLAATAPSRRGPQRRPRRLAPGRRVHRPRRRHAQGPRCPGGSATGSPGCAGGCAWRPTPPGLRALRPPPVGRGQRPAPGRRLGAAALQRGGLRRRHARHRPGHAQPPPSPGAGPRRHRRRPRRRRRRRPSGPPCARTPAAEPFCQSPGPAAIGVTKRG